MKWKWNLQDDYPFVFSPPQDGFETPDADEGVAPEEEVAYGQEEPLEDGEENQYY